MSDHDKVVHTFECAVCHQKKTPFQQDIVCGKCVHSSIELIRNSVIENEARNMQMRSQIDAIFSVCEGATNGTSEFQSSMALVDEQRTGQGINSDYSDTLRPGSKAVLQLALHLQKLEVSNRTLKIKGLEKSKASLNKRNESLVSKIEAATKTLADRKSQISNSHLKMTEQYNRKLDALDREIGSIKQERMARVLRQAALKQFSDYKVIRERYFVKQHISSGIKNLEFCGRPILDLSSLPGAQISEINAFLEDLIRLQLVLYDLFVISHGEIHLPYLPNIKKLLPDRTFFESVQSKVESLMGADHAVTGEADSSSEKANLSDNFADSSLFMGGNPDKITIKDKAIQVPRSSRTMNTKRRSSVRGTEGPDHIQTTEIDKKAEFEGNTSAFILVGQKAGSANGALLKPSYTAQASGNDMLKRPKMASDQSSITAASEIIQNKNSRAALEGKRIVIVPHRILTKPFSKLRPNEYLKFVSIVVKILVTYNQFLDGVLGPQNSKQPKQTQQTLSFSTLESSHVRPGPESHTGGPGPAFIYSFKDILFKIAHLDEILQNQEHTPISRPTQARSPANISTSMEVSELVGANESYQSMINSQTKNGQESTPDIPVGGLQKIRDLYTRLVGKNDEISRSSRPTTVSDTVIFGMVSETTAAQNSSLESKDTSVEVQNHPGSASAPESLPISTSASISASTLKSTLKSTSKPSNSSAGLNLKEISQNVHDLISGKNHHRGGGPRAHGPALSERMGANSVMQQSRAHLDDWDVVSKMF